MSYFSRVTVGRNPLSSLFHRPGLPRAKFLILAVPDWACGKSPFLVKRTTKRQHKHSWEPGQKILLATTQRVTGSICFCAIRDGDTFRRRSMPSSPRTNTWTAMRLAIALPPARCWQDYREGGAFETPTAKIWIDGWRRIRWRCQIRSRLLLIQQWQKYLVPIQNSRNCGTKAEETKSGTKRSTTFESESRATRRLLTYREMSICSIYLNATVGEGAFPPSLMVEAWGSSLNI